ncbi:MAG TPA: protein-export chaperone SecB [Gammaproteobacteria bacterium]|jgi:preprotein translocase subunit SecB|nr:protein-export chaperone SecB [Gammaproteobacteria bacterium]
MAEEQNTAEGEGAKPAQNFRIQKVYIKDVSFESPNTPTLFVGKSQWKPEVNLQLNSESRAVATDVYETVLTVTVTVKSEEQTAYLIEVKQAGLFTLQGFDDNSRGGLLGSYCPNILFPFAREVVADLVVKGGFPQLLLEPINFDALYAQHLEQAKQNAPASDTPQ